MLRVSLQNHCSKIKIIVHYLELLLRRTRSTPQQSCQGHRHLKLLLPLEVVLLQRPAASFSGLLYRYFFVDGLHCLRRRSVRVSSTRAASMGDSNVIGNINAMRGFAVL